MNKFLRLLKNRLTTGLLGSILGGLCGAAVLIIPAILIRIFFIDAPPSVPVTCQFNLQMTSNESFEGQMSIEIQYGSDVYSDVVNPLPQKVTAEEKTFYQYSTTVVMNKSSTSLALQETGQGTYVQVDITDSGQSCRAAMPDYITLKGQGIDPDLLNFNGKMFHSVDRR